MRSEPEIDADFRRLYESLRWIIHTGNDQDKRWFDEAKNLLALDLDCEVEVKLLGENRVQVIAYLEEQHLQVPLSENPLPDNCNGIPATCPRLAAKGTPYCQGCQRQL